MAEESKLSSFRKELVDLISRDLLTMEKSRAVTPVGIIKALVLPLVLAGAVSHAHGQVSTLVDNGPSANRVDIVFMGDGYTAGDDINVLYPQHIQSFLDYTFGGSQDPFPRYQNFFNVHRIDVVSNEAGADIPPDGVFVDTALDSKYYHDGTTERLLYVSNFKAGQTLNNALSGTDITAEMRVITVNSDKYGGGGGSYAVYAGGNGLHEIGHQFARLADEYVSFNTPYTGSEPSEANVTRNPNGKWGVWLGYNDPDHPEIGPIGVYEGGRYYETDIFRPSQNSKMRSLNRAFDAVSREQIIRKIYELVDPIDVHTPTLTTLLNSGPLLVEVIDPAVIDLRWSVDDVFIDTADDDNSFDPRMFGYAFGTYEVRALAEDNTPWVRTPSIKAMVSEEVVWEINITGPAIDLDGSGSLTPDDVALAFTFLDAGEGFDLDGSGTGDQADIDYLIGTMIGTAYGDANLDLQVDIEDLSVLAGGFGLTGQIWSGGDFDGNGLVDLTDLSLLAGNWGFVASSVPEPVTAVGSLVWAVWLRRRGQLS
ncbi:MAG: M64 family metallopeptidase [Phycisphaeraceae bacterium]